ncbi:hydroxymethylpyrimidine/phosphomethylpyrimidine kinase [Duganella sp. FT80W]|uniref:hydroxymethylpyrimidine kinase n=1 Tax=Duganella guangzhouensis TaxID=2666084 RepID=A0A6I2L3M8_9BURK|nr:hydroxymethylpyrimidine/phosphomethylpyrimidine kinase [Duganella guangzhouensis]MRW91757.1 hydroxymethylpyrimidine/phosphomethylpyrimidine kinase [Duganella guangzhouensis]
MTSSRPCVLVFAGLDPSGGAGLTADAQAVAGQGAHALTVCTALTVQDNDRVHGVQPVDAAMLLLQAAALTQKIAVSAVKIGITGSAANARAIAEVIVRLREQQPELPVVLDPVLASGHGDLLSRDDAVQALAPLLPLATVLTPNGVEARMMTDATQAHAQAAALHASGCQHVLITGGHDDGDEVVNRWYAPAATATATAAPASPATAAALGTDAGTVGRACVGGGGAALVREWRWARLAGEFHGSGCTLAAAIAGQLALGLPLTDALDAAQRYTWHALRDAYAIAPGQRIPSR